MTTKKRILVEAETLFNELGYNSVSMRDVADKLDMSVGNLTYHYKKKEDLVEAVIIKQHEQYQIKEAANSLAELDAFFFRMLNFQEKKGYYFRHYRQLSQISKEIFDIQAQVIHDLQETLYKTLVNLQVNGIIQEEEIEREYEFIIQGLLSILIYGLPLLGRAHRDVATRKQCLWTILYPLLTSEGKIRYRKEICQKQ